MALTQAVLGANPLTAGLGLVAPEAIQLLCRRDGLSGDDVRQKSIAVVARGAFATALVCSGPLGCAAVMGLSIASAYGKAQAEASPQAVAGPVGRG